MTSDVLHILESDPCVDVEVLLYVHRNRRFIRDGELRTSTSTFTQPPELWVPCVSK